LPAGGHAPHKNAIVLRVDHGRAIAEERAFADDTWIVRENRDARFAVPMQQPQDNFVLVL
jgi:hypothetical protein